MSLAYKPFSNMEIIGYHGTNRENFDSISRSNFRPSQGEDEWLGHGVYFFIEGIACPIDSAESWALAEAWNNVTKGFDYEQYCVVSVKIVSDSILDLRIEEDLKQFNLLRHVLYRIHSKHFLNAKGDSHDNFIVNLIMKKLEKEIVICNLYIKSSFQRIKKIVSRIPNVTVMCVINGGCIDLGSITQVKVGRTNEY